ncbi:hypothetical protein BDR06DRAFT_433805 [Suillus hirtellus]|nr:hypothetical protein BDR06DRAFT_433805 [Suillus hirtellus]
MPGSLSLTSSSLQYDIWCVLLLLSNFESTLILRSSIFETLPLSFDPLVAHFFLCFHFQLILPLTTLLCRSSMVIILLSFC